jgi:hypothetical protein
MLHNARKSAILLIGLILVLGLAVGCQKKGEEIPLDMPEEMTEEVPMPAVPSKIMVPEDVAAKWKAVVLEVTDKDTNERTNYTMNIGETAPLGNTGLNVQVEAFLPSFQMAGDVFTSSYQPRCQGQDHGRFGSGALQPVAVCPLSRNAPL